MGLQGQTKSSHLWRWWSFADRTRQPFDTMTDTNATYSKTKSKTSKSGNDQDQVPRLTPPTAYLCIFNRCNTAAVSSQNDDKLRKLLVIRREAGQRSGNITINIIIIALSAFKLTKIRPIQQILHARGVSSKPVD